MNFEELVKLTETISPTELIVQGAQEAEAIPSSAIGLVLYKWGDCIVKIATDELGLVHLRKERTNHKKFPDYTLPIKYLSPCRTIQIYEGADVFEDEESLETHLEKSIYEFTTENLEYIKAIEDCGLDVAEQTYFANLCVYNSNLVFLQYSVDKDIEETYDQMLSQKG